jgi:putative phage-type endonuclease
LLKETHKDVQMLNDEQRELRRTGLGGSDISTLLGLNPYSNLHQLYLEKVEGFTQDLSQKEAVIWGNLLEDSIAKRYAFITNRELAESGTVRHHLYPYFVATPDRLILNERRGLEIKNVGLRSSNLWGISGSKQIPEYYYTQVMHYLFVFDYDFWDVAALIGGNELRIYEFERDREFDRIIIEAGTDFWQKHVEAKVPPAIDYAMPNAKALVKRMYNDVVKQETVELDDQITQWRDVWLEAKDIIKKYQSVADGAQAHILGEMKNAETGMLKDGTSFVRRLIKTKGFTVPASEYVNFTYKKGKIDDHEH